VCNHGGGSSKLLLDLSPAVVAVMAAGHGRRRLTVKTGVSSERLCGDGGYTFLSEPFSLSKMVSRFLPCTPINHITAINCRGKVLDIII